MNNTKYNIKIDYATLVSMIDKEKTVVVANVEGVVHDLIKKAQEDEYNYSDETGETTYEVSIQYKMNRLANYFCDDTLSFQGTSNAFHNLAVDFSRQEMTKEACFILERGIRLRPASVDLLADFLLYGREVAERREDCKHYFKILSRLSRSKWNWRAFSFSISHLLEERFYTASDKEEQKLKERVLGLSNEFISRFSKVNADQEYIDRAYSDKASIYHAFGDPENEYITLKTCTEKYSRVPMTALRLAEIMFSSGDYSAAIEHLNKCVYSLNPQPSVNQGYIFLLRAYCNASVLLRNQLKENSGDEDFANQTEIISDINRDLDTAEPLIENPTYEKAIETLRSIMEKQIKKIDTNEATQEEANWRD